MHNALGRFPHSGCAAPDHANDPDQQAGADEPKDQIADPSAEHDPKNTENRAGDRRADDAEYDIHEQAHIALHELLGQPASNSADDNGRDPTNFSIRRHGASPQSEMLLSARLAQLARAALRSKVDQMDAYSQLELAQADGNRLHAFVQDARRALQVFIIPRSRCRRRIARSLAPPSPARRSRERSSRPSTARSPCGSSRLRPSQDWSRPSRRDSAGSHSR